MPRIYHHDKFKMCREFIIKINSDVLKVDNSTLYGLKQLS
jgi:hypothetical protein